MSKSNELYDIKEQIKDLLEQAREIVRDTPAENRAEYYWYRQIKCILDNDHCILGGSMCTIQDTIDELFAGYS